MKETFYIATAIAYASKKPHIGNIYEVVMADAIARYKRNKNYDVFFLTGTDEHGQKIEDLAKESNCEPKKYVDKVSLEIKQLFDNLNISYDGFIRTTDDNHVKTVQKIFKQFFDQGDIYKGHYEGLYCIACESFFTETQASENKCPDCQKELTKTKEEAYFFKMSKYQQRLIEHIEKNEDFIVPESRKNEMINNFLKTKLPDLCVSRTSFKWGVPVEFDENHVVYVWIDALSNYITALGYKSENDEKFKKYWPCDLHLIGKDILRFHVIYWPIMLMALGEELPKQILGHPWLLVDDDKMSKSKGNVIYSDFLAKHFSNDAVRYFILSEMPYANDGKITYDLFIKKYNSDLANTIGNLVSRTVSMIDKYFDKKIKNNKKYIEYDIDLINTIKEEKNNYFKNMDEYKLSSSIESIMKIARRANKYIDETMPWILCKNEENKERLETVLFCLYESIRQIAVLLNPIIPNTSENILSQLNRVNDDFDSIDSFGNIENAFVNTKEALFLRVDEDKKIKEINKDIEQSEEIKKEENLISIDDFFKSEIVVSEVISCEDIKRSDKLYKFIVNDGERERQIVSGVKKYHTKEELIGKKVLIVKNLKPVKLCGNLSEGMILSSEKGENVKVLTVCNELENGSRLC